MGHACASRDGAQRRPPHQSNDLDRSRTQFVGQIIQIFSKNVVGWPAPGSEDTELGVLMELEVRHGETEVYP
jgi:hypothetical protein